MKRVVESEAEGHLPPARADSLGAVAAGMIFHSREHLVARWNWKAALTSSFTRGGIFFIVNLTVSVSAANLAFLIEFVYRGVASGFFGAASQNFSRVKPAWHGTVAAMVVLPILAHLLEFAVHSAAGTPMLRASVLASVCFTAVSTWFHVAIMRDGLLTVDDGSQSLWSDLKQIPQALFQFAAEPVRRSLRLVGSFFSSN